MAALSIRSSGWVKTMQRFRRFTPAGSSISYCGQATAPFATDVARMVRIAATRGPFRATCLPRSAVLWMLLRRERLDAEIRLGVRRCPRGFEAHAWVEVNGRSLDESVDAAFAPLRTVAIADVEPARS